ncbi:SH3 domain-containing protein [Pontibacter sp. XAAS-A31]|nr:SH3 domain-containing protein [Pontibacter harenae]MCC9166298.1 SH3 domain-containing protein [Pontibacter harenae]
MIFLFSAFIALSCSNSETSGKTEKRTEEVNSSEKAAVAKTVVVYEIPTIKKLFITKSSGSYIYEKPDKESTVLDTIEYGYKIDVIGEEENWYQIKERIGRSFVRNGQQVASSGWEVVYVPKANVGQLTQIKLRAMDLYKTLEQAQVKGKVEISLIGKEEFEKARSKDDKFIIQQNALVSSKDSVLVVTIANGKKEYVSSPNAEESMKIFNYVGHVGLLNAYLLAIGYYEEGEHMLYSADNGKEIISFNDYPYFSPDGKYVVSIYTNPYSYSSDFQLYKVESDQKVRKVLDASFSKWMVALEPQEIFWLDSSTLVVKVLHAQAFWDENGGLNNDYQYLKIKIL